MKRDLVYALVIVFLSSLLTLFLFKSCSVGDRYSELRGQYEAYREETTVRLRKLKEEVSRREKRIVQLKEDILQKNEVFDSLQRQVEKKTIVITRLEKERELLVDKDAVIQNLDKQVAAWKEKYLLEVDKLRTVEAQRNSWKAAYEYQLEVSESLKEQLAREERLRRIAEESLKLADKKLRRARLNTNIRTAVIGGLVGYLGYKLLK